MQSIFRVGDGVRNGHRPPPEILCATLQEFRPPHKGGGKKMENVLVLQSTQFFKLSTSSRRPPPIRGLLRNRRHRTLETARLLQGLSVGPGGATRISWPRFLRCPALRPITRWSFLF